MRRVAKLERAAECGNKGDAIDAGRLAELPRNNALFARSMLQYSTRLIVSGFFIAAKLTSIVGLTLFLRGLLRN